MSDDDPLFDIERDAIARVQDRAVLNIGTLSDPDWCDVATNTDVMHDRASVTNLQVATYVGRW
ncbi:MAG: hypothetical protein DHS20C16_03170 [Phycisphaerae bacterium]|nr:MAG: hypothetical protein DHS20C16_03170 [Phycisphaerae bacterium]